MAEVGEVEVAEERALETQTQLDAQMIAMNNMTTQRGEIEEELAKAEREAIMKEKAAAEGH